MGALTQAPRHSTSIQDILPSVEISFSFLEILFLQTSTSLYAPLSIHGVVVQT